MRAAKTRMRSAFGQGGILASVGALAALAASIVAFSSDVALAQNAECARLQQAIAARRGSSGSQAAVERQRAELGAHQRLCALARLREPQVPVFRLGAAAAMRRAQRPDLAHAGQSRRPAGARGRRGRRPRRPLQRRMRSRTAVRARQCLRGSVRRHSQTRGIRMTSSRRWTPDSRTTAISRVSRRLRARRGPSRRTPAPMRSACAPATAASSPFPIQAPEAGRTASRTFAGPYAPTPTWRSIHSRSAARSTRPRRRPASLTQILPNAGKFEKASIRAAPAGARGKAGPRRSPTRKRAMATRSTTFW